MTARSGVSTLLARTGVAIQLAASAALRIVNIHGSQVVDTWALGATDTSEFLSMTHTRAMLKRLTPREGDLLYSNRRRAMLRLERDTSPGRHDTLIPACDVERYRLLGAQGFHANCAANFAAALVTCGVRPPPLPDPLNLFMNIPWADDGTLEFATPLSKPGDEVVLRALDDVIVVLSACPQDLVPINGAAQQPMDIQFEILSLG